MIKPSKEKAGKERDTNRVKRKKRDEIGRKKPVSWEIQINQVKYSRNFECRKIVKIGSKEYRWWIHRWGKVEGEASFRIAFGDDHKQPF